MVTDVTDGMEPPMVMVFRFVDDDGKEWGSSHLPGWEIDRMIRGGVNFDAIPRSVLERFQRDHIHLFEEAELRGMYGGGPIPERIELPEGLRVIVSLTSV